MFKHSLRKYPLGIRFTLGFLLAGSLLFGATKIAAGKGDISNGTLNGRMDAIEPIFKALKVGQMVNIEEKAGGWLEIHLLNDGAIGTYKVIELGSGYLLVEDIVSVSRRWITVTSIRSVVWTQVPTR